MQIKYDGSKVQVSVTMEEALKVCQLLVDQYPVTEDSDFYLHDLPNHIAQLAAVMVVISEGTIRDPGTMLYLMASLIRRTIELSRENQQGG